MSEVESEEGYASRLDRKITRPLSGAEVRTGVRRWTRL